MSSSADFPSGAAVRVAQYATPAEAAGAAAYLRRAGVPAGSSGPQVELAAGDTLAERFSVFVDADEWSLAQDLLRRGPGLGADSSGAAA